MARLSRLSLPGHLHHVIQRGNNGQPVFINAADYRRFLDLVYEGSRRVGVLIHAYVLLPNQFNFLATPESALSLSQLMQAVGRAYVRYFNDLHGRTGTLWEGRYRSTLIQPESYLFPCMTHIDWAPLRGGLVEQPVLYPWSSHSHYAGLNTDRLVTPHSHFWTLGNTPFAREAAYSEMVRRGVTQEKEDAILNSTLRGWALGSEEFIAALQKLTERRVRKLSAGRPAGAAGYRHII